MAAGVIGRYFIFAYSSSACQDGVSLSGKLYFVKDTAVVHEAQQVEKLFALAGRTAQPKKGQNHQIGSVTHTGHKQLTGQTIHQASEQIEGRRWVQFLSASFSFLIGKG